MIASSRPQKDIIWLVDTGASDDLIGSETTKKNGLRTFKSEYPKKFSTAGGLIKVEEQASVQVKGIDTSITPWISLDCPELLSVGKRINEGHSFVLPQRGTLSLRMRTEPL